jgi:hypothetical protein
MRISSFVLLASIVVLHWTSNAQSPAPATGSVTGRVFCTDTHTPCRFASVTLQSVQSVAHTKSVGIDKMNEADWKAMQGGSYFGMTGIDGNYVIEGVPPGEYYIHSNFKGYLDPYELALGGSLGDSALGIADIEKTVPKITVAADKPVNADLSLTRGAALEGVIRYDDGAPVYLASVHIYRKDAGGQWNQYGAGYLAGHHMVEAEITDDRGRFFFPGLVPGIYVVEADLPQPHILSGIGIGLSSSGAGSIKVYNGNKYRRKDAAPVELKEGEDRSDIEIDIPTNALHTLQGAVNSQSDGRPIVKGTVRLLDPDDKTVLRDSEIHKDGSFSIPLVPSGPYLLELTPQEDDRGKASPRYKPITVPLDVENDLLDLTYSVAPANH